MAESDVIINLDLNTDNVAQKSKELRDELSNAIKSFDGKPVSAGTAKMVTSMQKAIVKAEKLEKTLADLQSTRVDFSKILNSDEFKKLQDLKAKKVAVKDVSGQFDSSRSKLEDAKASQEQAKQANETAIANKKAAEAAKQEAKEFYNLAKAIGTAKEQQVALKEYRTAKANLVDARGSVADTGIQVEEANKAVALAKEEYNKANEMMAQASGYQTTVIQNFANSEAVLRQLEQDTTSVQNQLTASFGDKWSEAQSDIERTDEAIRNVKTNISGSNVAMQVLSSRALSASQGTEQMEEPTRRIGINLEKAASMCATLSSKMSALGTKTWNLVLKIDKAILNIAKSFLKVSDSAKKSNSELSRIDVSTKKVLTTVTKYVFGVRSLFFLIRKIRSFIMSGFTNIISFMDNFGTSNVQKEFKDFYNSIEQVRTALENLRYTLVAAFTPLVTVVAPYIAKVINWLAKLISYVGQLIAYLTGSKTYLVANAKAMKKLTEETKKNNKSNKDQLSSLDKLNNMTTSKDTKADEAKNYDPSKLFSRKPIEGWIKDFGDKLKAFLAKAKAWLKRFWDPIKKAWDKNRAYILSNFKNMIKNMIKFVGGMFDGFIRAWESNNLGERIASDLFHAFGSLLRLIGDIFYALDKAFGHNDNYMRFWEAILISIETVTKGIDDIITQFAIWFETTIDLTAVVDSLVELLYSMNKPVKFVVQVFKDFVRKVIEPLLEYLLKEKGLIDKIFKRLTQFNNAVNWNKLNKQIAEFFSNKLVQSFIDTLNDVYKMFDLLMTHITNYLNGNKEDIPPILVSIIDAIILIGNAFAEVHRRIRKYILNFLETGKTGNVVLDAILLVVKAIADVINKLGTDKVADIIEMLLMFKLAAPAIGALGKTFLIMKTLGNLKDIATGLKGLSAAGGAAQAMGGATATAGQAGGQMLGSAVAPTTGSLVSTVLSVLASAAIVATITKMATSVTKSYVKSNVDEGTRKSIEKRDKETGGFGLSSELFSGAGDLFGQSFEDLSNFDFIGFGKNFILGIVGGILGAVSFLGEAISKLFDFIWDGICSIFGIHSPATTMEEPGKNILLGLVEGFVGAFGDFFSAIGDFFGSVWDFISGSVGDIFSGVGSLFSGLVDFGGDALSTVSDGFMGAVDSVGSFVSDVGNDVFDFFGSMGNTIGDTFNGVTDTLGDFFSSAWDSTSEFIGEAGDGLLEFADSTISTFTDLIDVVVNAWDEFWKQMWDYIKVPINKILGAVEGLVNAFISGINFLIGALNKISFDVPDWVPAIGGSTWGFNISKMSPVKIPRLAQGTVVPPSASEFTAILGDNNKETEVVSPLSTMIEAFKTALADMDFGGSQQPISVNVDGHELFKIMQGQSRDYRRRYGTSGF